MYAVESFCLRASIVLGLVAAVVTILYFSPMPDQFFRSCDRPCHDLDWPMICRFKLTIESQKPITRDCEGLDQSDCDNSTKGLISSYLSPNNLLPGPSMQVCQNDVLVVDVVNKLSGHGITIHWRGQPQSEAPFMDGAPLITQCPINSYTTFQYKFRASNPGTHLWHAHAGSELADGIFGALIVRRASRLDPQRKLYDYDDKTSIILISEWTGASVTNLSTNHQKPKSLAINGKLSDSPYTFKVKPAKRYRFRAAYGGGITACPITLSIEEHKLRVISLDGIPVNPHIVNSIVLGKGERVDFVVKTNNEINNYNIKVVSNCDNNNLEGAAILNYMDVKNVVKVFSESASESREFTTELCGSEIGKVCLGDVQAIKKLPKALKKDVNRALYLPFDYKVTNLQTDDVNKVYRMNNITFTYPSSPLLTQFRDVPYESLCNGLTLPQKCKDQEMCECVHVEPIPLGASVELILIDQGGDENNIFHLHGYSFYIVASRTFKSAPSLDEIKNLDNKGMLFKRNTINPVQKDTIRIPKYGVVALRFIANNPGFWMLRDGNANQWTRGLDIVFQVGSPANLPSVPKSFPTCGSWVGPDFFLL